MAGFLLQLNYFASYNSLLKSELVPQRNFESLLGVRCGICWSATQTVN
jgi:hypothetical protein